MMTSRILIALLVSIATSVGVHAKCQLPEPDGSDLKPSRHNIHGTIAKLGRDYIVVKADRSNRHVIISRPAEGLIYSAFGGDLSNTELVAGQTVWIWYKECKAPKSGRPVPAYFQVYSKDLKDKP
jgi:hypothetical protein